MEKISKCINFIILEFYFKPASQTYFINTSQKTKLSLQNIWLFSVKMYFVQDKHVKKKESTVKIHFKHLFEKPSEFRI